MTALLETHGLSVTFALPRPAPWRPAPTLRAVDDVSMTLQAGVSTGVVGESGSGKSTLARTVVALERPSAGTVRLFSQDPFALQMPALKRLRRDVQMIFQDPYGSLNPRHRIDRIVAEPLDGQDQLSRADRRDRVLAALADVGLPADAANRHPHAFSGGQRQRVAIARALITRPKLIVADEPVSALDVSIQAQVLNLLQDLRDRHALTYLFISHDLSVVRHITERVIVMLHGRIVETGLTTTVLAQPAHPYTQALIAAVPVPVPPPGGRRTRQRPAVTTADGPMDGTPSAAGCVFAGRCPWTLSRCREAPPLLRGVDGEREAACHIL